MKKSLLKFLGVLAAIIIAFAIFVQMQPADFRIARSATMSAPPAAVFAQVNNLRNWQNWSPWARLDPDAKLTYDGPPEGVGASYAWAGNDKIGTGRMTVTESKPNEQVDFRLQFIKPFEATNATEFTFKPEGNQTVVTWAMSGSCNFMGKAMNLVMDCDKMVGGDFEKGLTKMKAIVESEKK